MLAGLDLSSQQTLFLAGERLIPTRTPGPARSSACRWSTAGGRPRPAGRSWRTREDWSPCRSRPARHSAMPGYQVEILEPRKRLTAGERGDSSGCRCRPATCRPSGVTSTVRRRLPLDLSRLLPDRRRRISRRGRVRVRDGSDRRRDQRRRTPAVDRGHRGGVAVASRGRRVCGDRSRRRAQGQLPRAWSWSRQGNEIAPEACGGAGRLGPRRDRCGRALRQVDVVPRCRRPGRARSCARRCARSPTGSRAPCRRPSRTRRDRSPPARASPLRRKAARPFHIRSGLPYGG